MENPSNEATHEPYFGSSIAICKVVHDINVAAPTNCAVLLLGATGTGKGVLARWIHEHSPRKNGAFVDINCAGLRGDLLKSELFGHARGAFTGAIRDHSGFIEAADGGTLFLDEVGDMDIATQSLLLKAVEEKTFRRVGENRLRVSNFRLISATNRDLKNDMENRIFREDLYYRINTMTIVLPALASRREDIPGLVNHILGRQGYRHLPLSDDVIEWLALRPWRGNIRELRNTLEMAMAFARGRRLTLKHFPEITGAAPTYSTVAQSDMGVNTRASDENANCRPVSRTQKDTWNIHSIESAHVRRAFEHFGYNKLSTAEALGISKASMYRWLEKIIKDDAKEHALMAAGVA